MLTKEEPMDQEASCRNNDTTEKGKPYMALELSKKNKCKAGFNVRPGQALWLRRVLGQDLGGAMAEIRLAEDRFGMRKSVEVESWYEAGRDGFWLTIP
jgi:hypothetical protein